jgi:NADH-quinone oxidoreductase subunit M
MTDTSTTLFSIPLTLVLPAAPLLFAAAHLVLSPRSAIFHYRLGLFGAVFTTIVSFAIVAAFAPLNGFQRRYIISLLPSITLPVRRGVDGLSLFFLPLTTGVTLLCILSLNPQTPRLREALIYLSVLQAGVLATFLALDLLAFFLFFERTLLPLFRLVLL